MPRILFVLAALTVGANAGFAASPAASGSSLSAPGMPAAVTPTPGPAVAPFALAWGRIAEPEVEGAITPARLAEHLEFLRAHGWQALRPGELAEPPAPIGQRVLLSFDHAASALAYALPLLELYQMPAVVTVSPAAAEDATLAATLAVLAASPWIELVPLVEERVLTGTPLCGPPGAGTGAGTGAGAGARRGGSPVDPTRHPGEAGRPAAATG